MSRAIVLSLLFIALVVIPSTLASEDVPSSGGYKVKPIVLGGPKKSKPVDNHLVKPVVLPAVPDGYFNKPIVSVPSPAQQQQQPKAPSKRTEEVELKSDIALVETSSQTSKRQPRMMRSARSAAMQAKIDELKQKFVDFSEKLNMGPRQKSIDDTVLLQTQSQTKTSTQENSRFIGQVIGAAASGNAGSILSGGLSALQARPASDVEDCVACRYVWLRVELMIGNSQQEDALYDSFTQTCMEAQQAPIFYAACQDMFDAIDDMIGDYMDGYTVNQMCENSRICR